MIEPYKLVFVNISFLLIFLIINYIFERIFPKKRIHPFIKILAITTIASLSILRKGTYESGDFNIHVYRSVEFFKNLLEGYIIPSWAGDLNSTYGLPLFIFNYNLPYYITSLIHLLGLSFINSMKIYLLLNIYLTTIFSYILGLEIFKKNHKNAFIFSVFYFFFPYHLVATHFKITIGEITVYTLLPLLLLSIIKLKITTKLIYLIYTSLIYYLIIISHIFIGIFIFPVIIGYLLLNNKNKLNYLYKFILISIIVLMLSAYEWMPTFIFKSYLYTSYLDINLNNTYFPSIKDLLYSPWRMGLLFQGPKGEISYLIGYVHILFIFICILFIKFKRFYKNELKELYFLLILLFIYLFLMLPYSKFLWNFAKMLGQVGPHRLLLIIGLISSLIATKTIIKFKNEKLISFILLLTIIMTILNWGHRRVIPTITEEILIQSLPTSTYRIDQHYYAATVFQDPKNLWEKEIPKNSFQENSNLKFSYLQRSQNKHVYKIEIRKDTLITENTLYFPGWTVSANNNKISSFPNNHGLLSFNLNKGTYKLEIIYEDILYLKIAKIISISTLSILIFLILMFKLSEYSKASNK